MALPLAFGLGVVSLAPIVGEGARRAWAWIRGSSGDAGPEVIAALPSGWTRWYGARPEPQGAPAGTILCVPGIDQVAPAVRRALLTAAQALSIPVDSLAAVIASESGWKASAGAGTGAVGLIQLTHGANLPSFTDAGSLSSVAQMDAVTQIASVVVPFFARPGPRVAGSSPGRLYMFNFLDGFVDQPESFVLATKGDAKTGWIYDPNHLAFDPAARGYFTVGDVYGHIANVCARAGGRRIAVDGTIVGPAISASSSAAGDASAPASSSGASPLEAQGADILGGSGDSGPSGDGSDLAAEGAQILGSDLTAAGPGCSRCIQPTPPTPVPPAPTCCASCAAGNACESGCDGDHGEGVTEDDLAALFGWGSSASMAGPGLPSLGPFAPPLSPSFAPASLGFSASQLAQLSPSFQGPAAAVAGSPALYQRGLLPAGTMAGPSELLVSAQAGASVPTWTYAVDQLNHEPGTSDGIVAVEVADADTAETDADAIAKFGEPGYRIHRWQEIGNQYVNGSDVVIFEQIGPPNRTASGPGRLRARAHASGPGSVRGLLLAAVQSGELTRESIAWTEVQVPALDLVVTVPLEALRCMVNGQPLPVGASYQDTIAICRALRCLPPTTEIVDAVWAASNIQIDGALLSLVHTAADATAERMQSIDFCIALNAALDATIEAAGTQPDALVRPQGKAWVISERLRTGKGAVNYGLQRLNGALLQPEEGGHDALWVDYSQTLADLVQREARTISTGQTVDALDVYRAHFSAALGPWLDVYA